MKRTVSLLLCLIMLLALCACGGQTAAPAAETTAPSAAPVEETAAQPEADALVVDTVILKEADDNMINTYSLLAVNPEAPFADADGNAVCSIDQQIRYLGRQNGRFLQTVIEVIGKINRILIYISQHFRSDF